MTTIQLENVSRKFSRTGLKFLPGGHGARRGMKDFEDKVFVDRVAHSEVATSEDTGPVTALDDLSLTIEDGETLAIVGPSGCGKSTLLRIIAGLEIPDEGRVLFDGADMADVRPRDRGIGMVFQSYALYPHMKGEGNLGFFFRVRKRPSEEMMERIRITSEIMGIGFETLLARKPGTLSGGQQQRVAIGRCIVRDPSLFLFDEPLSNLDAKLRVATRVEIKRLLHKFKITSIYVTHDQTEAITLGDRIMVMRAGRVEQIGTYREITTNPVNSFVAGFLGLPPMQILQGWTVADEGCAASAMGTIELPPALAPALSSGREITLGFRSESGALSASDEPARHDAVNIPATVLNSEPNFGQGYQLVNVEAGGKLFAVQAPIDTPINTGWDVTVSVPFEHLYCFDAYSELRITP